MNWSGGIKSGIISVVIALIFTYLASLIFPTSELIWAFIAVTIASFLSGFFGFQSGQSRSTEETEI